MPSLNDIPRDQLVEFYKDYTNLELIRIYKRTNMKSIQIAISYRLEDGLIEQKLELEALTLVGELN